MRGAAISRKATSDQPWDWVYLDNDVPAEYVRYLPAPDYVAPASEEIKKYLRKSAGQIPGPYSREPKRNMSNGERERARLAAEDPVRATFVDNVNEWARGQRWYVYLVLAHHLFITQKDIRDRSLLECSWSLGKYLNAVMMAEKDRQIKIRELQQRYGGSRDPDKIAYLDEVVNADIQGQFYSELLTRRRPVPGPIFSSVRGVMDRIQMVKKDMLKGQYDGWDVMKLHIFSNMEGVPTYILPDWDYDWDRPPRDGSFETFFYIPYEEDADVGWEDEDADDLPQSDEIDDRYRREPRRPAAKPQRRGRSRSRSRRPKDGTNRRKAASARRVIVEYEHKDEGDDHEYHEEGWRYQDGTSDGRSRPKVRLSSAHDVSQARLKAQGEADRARIGKHDPDQMSSASHGNDDPGLPDLSHITFPSSDEVDRREALESKDGYQAYLARILDAQNNGVPGNDVRPYDMSKYEQALEEITAGKKVSKWIPYIWPRHFAFGYTHSPEFCVTSLSAIIAWCNNDVLRERFVTITAKAAEWISMGSPLEEVFGSEDDFGRFRSCITMFHEAAKLRKFDDVRQVCEDAVASFQGDFDRGTRRHLAREIDDLTDYVDITDSGTNASSSTAKGSKAGTGPDASQMKKGPTINTGPASSSLVRPRERLPDLPPPSVGIQKGSDLGDFHRNLSIGEALTGLMVNSPDRPDTTYEFITPRDLIETDKVWRPPNASTLTYHEEGPRGRPLSTTNNLNPRSVKAFSFGNINELTITDAEMREVWSGQWPVIHNPKYYDPSSGKSFQVDPPDHIKKPIVGFRVVDQMDAIAIAGLKTRKPVYGLHLPMLPPSWCSDAKHLSPTCYLFGDINAAVSSMDFHRQVLLVCVTHRVITAGGIGENWQHAHKMGCDPYCTFVLGMVFPTAPLNTDCFARGGRAGMLLCDVPHVYIAAFGMINASGTEHTKRWNDIKSHLIHKVSLTGDIAEYHDITSLVNMWLTQPNVYDDTGGKRHKWDLHQRNAKFDRCPIRARFAKKLKAVSGWSFKHQYVEDTCKWIVNSAEDKAWCPTERKHLWTALARLLRITFSEIIPLRTCSGYPIELYPDQYDAHGNPVGTFGQNKKKR